MSQDSQVRASAPLGFNDSMAKLIDGWCERRALRPLRITLAIWPPPNGFTDEWQAVWAGLRHLRAMCRDELNRHGELDTVNALIACLSKRLFGQEDSSALEADADRLIEAIFGESGS